MVRLPRSAGRFGSVSGDPRDPRRRPWFDGEPVEFITSHGVSRMTSRSSRCASDRSCPATSDGSDRPILVQVGCIFWSRAGFCSRSRPMGRDSPSMKIPHLSASTSCCLPGSNPARRDRGGTAHRSSQRQNQARGCSSLAEARAEGWLALLFSSVSAYLARVSGRSQYEHRVRSLHVVMRRIWCQPSFHSEGGTRRSSSPPSHPLRRKLG